MRFSSFAMEAAKTIKCLQMANGSLYTDGQNYEVIHNAKLDALEEIIEEAGGVHPIDKPAGTVPAITG